VTLKVGVIPIVDVAPLYLGIEKGFFKQEGLTIEPVPAQGGAAIVPTVVAGDNQVGFSNVVSLILASSRGLPLETIAAGSEAVRDPAHSPAALMVAGNSSIRSAKDLEGKTIAVNTLNNIGDVTIKALLDQRGADVSKIKFIELAFSAMPVALKEGRVDAIWANEPFETVARNDGDRVLFHNYEEYDPKLSVAVYFTTRSFAAQHPDVVARFQRAMAKSASYAVAHPRDARAILPSYTRLEASVANTLFLPGWGTTINLGSVERLQGSMVKFGLLQKPTDLKPLFPASVASVAR
jgi:NitT/TauT family transport system substrate-binding protein